MITDGVIVNYDETIFTEAEIKNYVKYCKEKFEDGRLEKISVTLAPDGKVDLNYRLKDVPFERIRRITGYLTGDLMSWNNAKRAEESERVKHG